jgi:hypothetical protein
MQPSELFRRGIVVPLDEEAEKGLREYQVQDDINVHLLKIPDQELFESLWRIGLFRAINQRCGTLVDDYEEELVEPGSLPGILVAIDAVSDRGVTDATVLEFLAKLRALVREAVAMSRPVLFVL